MDKHWRYIILFLQFDKCADFIPGNVSRGPFSGAVGEYLQGIATQLSRPFKTLMNTTGYGSMDSDSTHA